MGSCFGLGCRSHRVSPTISITSTVPTHKNGVMPNHQPETISTPQPKTARRDFLNTGPISNTASSAHPFGCTPHSFRLSGNRGVTQSFEAIKSLNPGVMSVVITPAHLVCVISQLMGADGEGLHTGLYAVVAKGADIALAAPQPGTTKFWGVCCCS